MNFPGGPAWQAARQNGAQQASNDAIVQAVLGVKILVKRVELAKAERLILVARSAGEIKFLTKALQSLRSRLDEIDCDSFYDGSKKTGFVQCHGDVILGMPATTLKKVSRGNLRALLAIEIGTKVFAMVR